MFLSKKIGLLLFISLISHASFAVEPTPYDVVVYGATSAGVTASVQAARMGKNVLLISSTRYIGGVSSSGLGATDINNHYAVGGLSREFYQRIYAGYQKKDGWRIDSRETYMKRLGKAFYGAWNDSLKMQWMFEPHIAATAFKDLLNEAKVKVLYNERLDLTKPILKQGTTIKAITMESGKMIYATMFIDCTYEGDLMAKAGVIYTIGREANETYGEQFNGIRVGKVVGKGPKSIDPYLREGDPSSGPLPYIEKQVAGKEGDGDHRLQAYCYRFTLTTDPENRLPITKPANYQPSWFETTGRLFKLNPKMTLGDVLTLTPLPNQKTDTNHADFIGSNYAWPEANYKTRNEIEQLHRDFVLGLLWFLVSDYRIPERVKEEMKTFGLPKDEFKNNGNFPTDLYVREARRMVSDYVMTEHNYFRNTNADDAVGLGTYWLDSHVVSRFIDAEGNLRIDGSFWENKSSLYSISYRAIRPKRSECTNLLVPVCLSSSHAAYGSIRMEPVYMVLGQSAAIAACLCIDDKQSVQDLDYGKLQAALYKYGQILYPKEVNPKKTSSLSSVAQKAAVAQSDSVISAIITRNMPLKNTSIPADIHSRLGATHCDGRYFFSKEPFLIEGARKLDSLHMGILKLWLTKSPQNSYPFNSDWKLPPNVTLKDIAAHPYYKKAMDFPFTTIVLTNSGVSKGPVWKLSAAALQNEENEIYELSKYLLTTYKKRKVDFVIQNWEGDWLLRGGVAGTDWAKLGVPADINLRVQGMIAWFSARQRGVERARNEIGTGNCRVIHAIEVNKVLDCMKGISGLVSDVLPQVTTDMVSWSSYDGLDKNGLSLYKGIDYIRSKMKSSGYVKKNAIYIGEIGIPEEVANNKSEKVITERWDTYMGVLLAQKIPYIIHWELYCNEPKSKDLLNYPVKENDKMRGFWLIRPDGTLGLAANYFKKLL